MKATREQVLFAYRNNPKAELNPSEAAIQYWMTNGLQNFVATVNAARQADPALAARIDAERQAASGQTAAGPGMGAILAAVAAFYLLG